MTYRVTIAVISVWCVCSAWGWPWSKKVVAGDDGVANLGSVAVGTTARHVFAFGNSGNETLRIGKVETSCECLSIVSRPETIPPRSKGQIDVELISQKPGQFRYEITVECVGTPQTNRLFLLDVTVVGSKADTVTQPRPTVASSRKLPSRVTVNRDEQLYIPATRLARDLKEGRDVAVVDVRDSQAYAAAHIPRAFNIPLYLVKTKGFLRSKPVVLVDAGWGSDVVENECRRLRVVGFSDIHILRGGLNAWQSNEGGLEGAGTAKSTLSELDPQSFLSARSFDDWIVVNASPGASSTVGLIPEQIRVPYSKAGEKRFVKDIRALLAKRGRFTRLLLVNDDGWEYKQLQQAVGKLEGCAVFCLSGGQKTLEEQLNIMEAMRNSRQKTIGTPAVVSAGGSIRKPCGSCP